MLVNEADDCAICDVCIFALYPVVRERYMLEGGNPYQHPNGKPN